MDSSSLNVTNPDMLEESPHNDVQEEALSSKELIDQSQFNEGLNNHESNLSNSVKAIPPPMLSGSSENQPPPPQEKEREYGCRYCNKRFSNKQALGGHQNAHKLERTVEKNIQGTMHHGMLRYGRAPRPSLGINEEYTGWPRTVPGNITQFMARPGSSGLEDRPPGIRFSTPRAAPSGNFLGESSNVQKNSREPQYVELEDDSGLDLTLRL
ncbi:zinc finger 8-like [Olea europaea subsp. europaea]|uniref:Zinc finger 8-like n=1 Tax=Olea europaea subsp. europaea TaxID=158383 RepID=A0A8S0QVK6_OLEEU|nr:zinc finger 8-like [Olea europaea subsp. europaea]